MQTVLLCRTGDNIGSANMDNGPIEYASDLASASEGGDFASIWEK